jgi:hypothetical protein
VPKLTFFPLGNADCCLAELAGGERLLFDYANTRCADDPQDRRIDLAAKLREDMVAAKRTSYDVVAFSHLDLDHICGASEFFHLSHAAKYQGGDRFKIDTLWVPAAVIIEDGCEDEARIIQAEARHRLREGAGIRVFSRPAKLEDWLAKQGLTVASRSHLITDAGQVIPGFTKAAHGVEFFAHSPFASRLEDGTLLDRNTDALAVQATFAVDGVETKVLLASDLDHAALSEIVRITRFKNREHTLEWDVFKLPHHCSFLSLAADKGTDKTVPVSSVAWLFEEQGRDGGIVVSTSKVIPTNDDDAQPPHRQAAQYHRDVAAGRRGYFKVTMEHPSTTRPEPLVITIDRFKASISMRAPALAASVMASRTPRAGAR